MAPMAGVNTLAFCELLRDLGCDFIYTGLLTSHGLLRNNPMTQKLLDCMPIGVTLSAQIFGSAPDVMADAARLLESTGKAAVIDINMGCPVPKVVKSSAGVGLMKETELAGRIVREVVAAVKIPVTVKMRSGWDDDSINCIELALRCEGEGAAAVALHPRTRRQGFGGFADWRLICKMKEALKIPVIASGDITSPEKAIKCFDETGCDSIMIGRACMGDPGLIGRIRKYVETGEIAPLPDFRQRLSNAKRHLRRHVEVQGEERGVREARNPLARYARSLPDATTFRSRVNKTDTLYGVEELIEDYQERLEKYYETAE